MHRRVKAGERAVEHFLAGYNCAQSVLLASCELWGIKDHLIPKIATGFGAGIGRCGSVCGALVGGVMAISVRFGTDKPSVEDRLTAYALSQRLYRQFEQQNANVNCRQLIGYDLSKPEDLDKAYKARVFDEKCTVFVRSVIELLFDLTEN